MSTISQDLKTIRDIGKETGVRKKKGVRRKRGVGENTSVGKIRNVTRRIKVHGIRTSKRTRSIRVGQEQVILDDLLYF